MVAFGYVKVFISALVSRLTRDSLFPVAGMPDQKKVSKNACPYLGPPLRYGSPRYVVAPGGGVQGHPWPHAFRGSCRSTPYATTPLGLAVNGAGRSQARSKADQKPLSPALSPALSRKRERELTAWVGSHTSPLARLRERGWGRGALDLDLPAPFIAGRMESPCKGLSRRDAARGTSGQGRPVVPGPWSGDGMREPGQGRGKPFWVTFWGDCQKVTRA